MKHSILVVDDEKDIIDSLERQFRKDYKVFKSTSGAEALKILQDEKVSLIISDQRMPEMTGVQLFSRAQLLQPDAFRILLTGYTDVASVISAINTGQIYRYVTKPWDPTDLDIVVKKAIETFELKGELQQKNIQLQEALESLKSLDKAKTHFMILIGHELKTPLTTITSFTDLLKEEKASSSSDKYIGRIDQSVQRLNEIIFDVLDILRADVGQTPVKKELGSLEDILNSLLESLKVESQKNGLLFEIKSLPRRAKFDPAIVGKVLRKILHNAVKFADGNSSIVVEGKDLGSSINISVTNVGPLIPPDRLIKITKPFNVDEDIMHHSKGMGLGLSVCQSLLRAHGSKLTVTSLNQKTTVGFDLEK